MTYSDKLKDPRWQRKRLEIFNRDGWRCCECHEDQKTLHVHHRLYRREAEPWEYLNEELMTLCRDCHEDAERYIRWFDEYFKVRFTPSELVYKITFPFEEAEHLLKIHPHVFARAVEVLSEKPELIEALTSAPIDVDHCLATTG